MGFKLVRYFFLGLISLVICGGARAQTAPTFTQIIVFGDSLSDDGNVAQRVNDAFGFRYPSSNFNYSDYRFTNSNQDTPSGTAFDGVWHEQLARDYLSLAKATYSLGGGTDYAFGGATTQNGTQTRTVVNNPTPFGGGTYSITIDNMGKQVDDYLTAHPAADGSALFAVWGGGNDLFDDHTSTNVSAAAGRMGALITRLANAGARNFIVPNVPPLGAVPNSFGDAQKVAELNQASSDYRDQLNSVLASVKSTLATGGITIQVYQLDIWYDLIRLLAQPGTYGFTDVVDPGKGNSGNPDQYLFWDDIHPTTAGHHQIAGVAYNLLSGQIPALGKATNVSTRGFVGTGEQVLIGGLIINGSVSKQVLVRALGPSLAPFGINGTLADPTLTVYDSSNSVVATNDNWKSSQQAAIQATGYAPGNDSEAAAIVTLAPGNYTVVVSGVGNTTGISLFDAYDRNTAADSTFHNVSTRGFAGTGDQQLIGGFIVASGEPPLVVVRAIGPTLASFGITQPLADPVITLYDANGVALASNDDWQTNHPTAVKASLLQPPDTKESAIVIALPAGNYTAIVGGKNGTTGVALVEAYRLQ